MRDDVPLLVENPLLRAPDGLWRLLSGDFLAGTGFTSGFWRPLPLLTFWIEGRLGSWDPAVFHATNVLLAAGVAALVGLLLVQTGLPRGPATAASLWFATLPAHVEVVAWISARTDLLCGGLALLCLWLDRRSRAAGRVWPGWGATLALTGALLGKESAVAWPLVILTAEWVRARRVPTPGRAIARWLMPYLVVTAAWLVAHALASGPASLPPYVDAALKARRQAAGWFVVPQYLSFLWPWYPHASDVPLALPASPAGALTLAASAFTLLAIAGWAALAQRRSALAVPWGMVLAPMLPAIVVAIARGFLASGERMVFLASAGVAWLVGEALARAWGRAAPRAAALACVALLVVAGTVETTRLVPLWADDEHVFRTMSERQPRNPAGWVGLGETWARLGRTDQAERALERAAALDPRLPSVAMARAELYYRTGAWSRVLTETDRALALDPSLYQARLVRASTLVRLGRAEEAGPDIERMAQERPGDPSALMVAGQRFLALGRPGEAIAPLAAATQGAPGDPALWSALGSAQAVAGDMHAARTSLERAISLDPGAPMVWRRLASVCAALGDSAAARAALERAGAPGSGPGGEAPR